jgi:hypothetical protein
MSGIAKAIDGYSIAAEIRMERQLHKGSFLLIEGESDELRILKFVDESSCSITVCFGKPNVLEAVEVLNDDGFAGCVALVDADFDRASGTQMSVDVVYSNLHDFDLDVAWTPALERYLREVADADKLRDAGDVAGVRKLLVAALHQLSAMRWANEQEGLRYRLSELKHENFFDGKSINIEAMINEVSQGTFASTVHRTKLKALIEKYSKLNVDILQITCGHDFCAGLGIALRSELGSRRPPQSWRSEVEMHLRLTYDWADFSNGDTYKSLRLWEAENQPYRVLLPN